MSGEEDGYDPNAEKQTQKQSAFKFRPTKNELKKLNFVQVQSKEEEQDQITKSRRAAHQTQKGYYQELSFQINEERAKKYWAYLDQLYFQPLNIEDVNQFYEKIQSEGDRQYLLEDQYNNNNRLLRHSDYLILNQYPEIRKQTSSIKTLFQNQQKETILAFYKIEESKELPRAQSSDQIAAFRYVGGVKVDKSLFQQKEIELDEQTQLEKEIIQWETLNQRIKVDNSIELQKLKTKLQIPELKLMMSEQEIRQIKQMLYWSTIQKLFITGHRDKTNGIFDYYNIMGDQSDIEQAYKTKKPKKFETDCKICFCSSNYQSNIVVYCDICNTSFHIICYGLSNIPKTQKYYCQVCTEFKLIQNKQRPHCKICQKKYFPMKKLDEHYYHVTCLVLFNFVEFRNLQMKLRKDVTFKTILNIVIKSELKSYSCEFCYAINGIKYECCYPGCNRSFHPICAYLNGCLFFIERKFNCHPDLDVKVQCNYHDPNRNHIEQVYYRRYVCDYKKTSKYTLEEFKPLYQRQLEHFEEENFRDHEDYHQILAVNKNMKQIREKLNSKQGKVRTEVSKMLKDGRKQTA